MVLTDTLSSKYICFHLINISNKLNSTLKIELAKPNKSEMFELKSYEKFRDTEDVRFFDISINNSNFRDLVIHNGPAVSPPNDKELGNWQFYIHHKQEDNLLAISGGRTFYLVNLGWEYPFYKVRLESCGLILKIPRGTFHRSVSDENGSVVLNQAIRDKEGSVETEFKVTNSKDNKKLHDCITNLQPKFKIYSVK